MFGLLASLQISYIPPPPWWKMQFCLLRSKGRLLNFANMSWEIINTAYYIIYLFIEQLSWWRFHRSLSYYLELGRKKLWHYIISCWQGHKGLQEMLFKNVCGIYLALNMDGSLLCLIIFIAFQELCPWIRLENLSYHIDIEFQLNLKINRQEWSSSSSQNSSCCSVILSWVWVCTRHVQWVWTNVWKTDHARGTSLILGWL